LSQSALEHYRRGNRFFDLKAFDRALEEWRRSSLLWRFSRRTGRTLARPWAQLRAVVLLLLTVLLVYNAIFTLFPRNPFDMLMLGAGGEVTIGGEDQRGWWARWLDTGRPGGGGGGERVDLRDWWLSLRERWGQGSGEGGGGKGRGRPGMDQRWEELLRRYGRWGPMASSDINYYVIAGYGLSRMGEYQSAVEAFEKGLAKAKQPAQLAELYQGLANTHYYQGYKLQPDGLATYNLPLVKKASEAYERSTQYETRPLSFGNLGWMYFLLGEYKLAESYSRRALNLDPSLEYVRLNLGLIYMFQGRNEESYNTYLQVIRRNPPEETYLGGINDLREVLRDHPGRYPYAYLMLGLLAVKSGAYTQAQDALSRFIAAPNVPEVWRARAARMLRTMEIGESER
jgi:tetratricopeptide (TPR) repeat protein